jgi:hypothetical protein
MFSSIKSFPWVCLLAVTAVSMCGTLCAQSGPPCTYSLFKYPGTTITSTTANGINKYNTIVGTAQDQSGTVFGFIRYSSGSFKRYAVPGAYNTQFFHRSDSGATVGFYQSASGPKHGLLLSGSTLTTIDYPGATGTVLTGINRWGTIVGYYTDSTEHLKGFKRYSSGGFSAVSIPNHANIMPMDINDSGVIAGILGTGGPTGIHGFLAWQNNWVVLDDPAYPPSSTGLNGIGNGGSSVGEAFDSNGAGHAIWLFGNSNYFNLAVPGAVESVAGDIFSSPTTGNVIVGGATIPGGGDQAFVARCQ